MGSLTKHLEGLPHWLFVQYVAFRVRIITILYALHILDRLKHKNRFRLGVEAITWYFDQRELQAPCSANDSNGFSLKGNGDTYGENHPRDEGGDEEAVRHGVCECGGTRQRYVATTAAEVSRSRQACRNQLGDTQFQRTTIIILKVCPTPCCTVHFNYGLYPTSAACPENILSLDRQPPNEG